MKKYFALSFLFSFSLLNLTAQNVVNIVPMPAEIKTGKGFFNINANTIIVPEGGNLEKTASLLSDKIQKNYGFKLKTGKKYAGKNAIRLNFERMDYPLPGAYTLTVNNQGINIAGDNEEGVFYGMQTLLQLLPATAGAGVSVPARQIIVPQCFVSDHPRFAYRGMHLDVGRHFFPVDFIKRYIDFLAAYKYNNFHWHLTEDQGWRIEIKKYPLLTETGSCRDRTLIGRYGSNRYDSIPYCGYYTQEQIKEIIKYAADRYINVIPEIEMPGHSTAALASYPFLGCTRGPYKVMDTWGVLDDVFCAGNDSTYQFIEDVLDEVVQLFPSKYIHIGGDECPKGRWKSCPVCQKKIKDEGLKDEQGLQSYFIRRIEKYLAGKGKNIIGWDEILEGGLAARATVMSWRGEQGGIDAAKQGHDVIMTPGSHCYLDYSQGRNEDSLTIGGYIPLEKVYSYEPIPEVLNNTEARHILGAQGNVWTEYMTNPAKVEYMIFPRMLALSEVLWSPKDKRNWNDFERRLPALFSWLDAQKINYSKAYYDLRAAVIPNKNHDGVLWKLESKNPNDQIVFLTGTEDSRLNIYKEPIQPQLSGFECSAWIQSANGERTGNPIKQKFLLNKSTGKKITLSKDPSPNYPGDGAFTLVNGVQNSMGLARSSEFLGFLTSTEVVIDMGETKPYGKITLHAFKQEGSWIYQPERLTVFTSNDGQNYISMGYTDDFVSGNNGNGTFTVNFGTTKNRYVKLVIDNYGTIPSGKPGAGNPAWMFLDEIEAE